MTVFQGDRLAGKLCEVVEFKVGRGIKDVNLGKSVDAVAVLVLDVMEIFGKSVLYEV